MLFEVHAGIVGHTADRGGGFCAYGLVMPAGGSGTPQARKLGLRSGQRRRSRPPLPPYHLLGYNPDFESAKAIAIALTQPENAPVFAGYTAVEVVVGTVPLHRRDTN